jgi:acetate kinase
MQRFTTAEAAAYLRLKERKIYENGGGAKLAILSTASVFNFVFTARIGENSDGIRARISEKLAWLGAELDTKANADRKPLVSRPESRVKLYVIPTDEELMIAEHTLATIAQSKRSDLIALR